MFKRYNTDNGYHDFSLTKVVTFHDPDSLVYYEDLYTKLLQDDFGDIKVPRFTFSVTDTQLIINTEYIKGRQWQSDDLWHNFDFVANNIVFKDGDYSFTDFEPTNFIQEIDTNDVYYVDYESYDICTINERSNLLQRQRKMIEDNDPELKSFRRQSRFKML